MNISIPGVECKVTAHKYALMVKHVELEEPFRIVVYQVLQENTGENLGWIAVPEIQLRQTTELKQKYIMSNANPTPEEAVKECIFKMMMTTSREIFYETGFEERNNRLW